MDLKPDNQGAAADSGGASTQASRASAARGSGVEVKLSPGGAAELIKLYETGALVETPSRFSIGALCWRNLELDCQPPSARNRGSHFNQRFNFFLA